LTTLARSQVDLHCHTRRSDGLMEPRDLYAAARAYGMRLVSITDHDTLAGYRELREAGFGDAPGPAGPQLIPGVEINTRAATVAGVAVATATGASSGSGSASGLGWGAGSGVEELHILGLGVSPDDDEFEALLGRQREARRGRIEEMAQRLRELGMPVDAYLEQTLPASVASAGRPHVARALILAGYAESIDDAMIRWLGPGAPAWVPPQGIGTLDAIGAIRRAGGLPSLAHFAAAPQRLDLLRELRDAGLGGLEVYYRAFPPGRVTELAATARTLSLVPTGGSDYHGDLMTYAESQDLTRVPIEVGEGVLAALSTANASRSSGLSAGLSVGS
jgi:predicted metal-dependent phosphoesterase TrpH